METRVHELIATLDLIPHPEGGYYRETYKSDLCFDANKERPTFSGRRSCGAAIYFLLEGNNISRMHRIKADELWHFYEGAALSVHVIHPDGTLEEIRLGTDTARGETFQALVKAGCWFGASLPNGGHALVGCTTHPGFEFEDFHMAERADLLNQWPEHETIIKKLTP
ncbi:cupin domain-containing protein [Desulfoluna sp.]|uniref:cupin domain-containing protein n=1 Tax=Desulfoluna sp. TaxID=2045199 RepID=UPI0026084105|nr:cupin domain-containing protein [Desulfoluna sp.]